MRGRSGRDECVGHFFDALCAHSGHDVHPPSGAIWSAHSGYFPGIVFEEASATGKEMLSLSSSLYVVMLCLDGEKSPK